MSADRIEGVSGVDPNRQAAAWESHLSRGASDVRNQVRKANKILGVLDVRAKFSVHEGTGNIIVKLEDTETGEVIREIPPEKLLDLIAKIQETASHTEEQLREQ